LPETNKKLAKQTLDKSGGQRWTQITGAWKVKESHVLFKPQMLKMNCQQPLLVSRFALEKMFRVCRL